MSDYTNLKSAIRQVIKPNGNEEITGQVLQDTLISLVSSVGQNATFAGVAVPTTNPQNPDGNVFYLATQNGTYSNFGGIVVADEVAILSNASGTWAKISTGITPQVVTSKIFDRLKNYIEPLPFVLDFADLGETQIQPIAGRTMQFGQTTYDGTGTNWIDYTNNENICEFVVISNLYYYPQPQLYKNVTIFDVNGSIYKEYALNNTRGYLLTLPSGYRILANCTRLFYANHLPNLTTRLNGTRNTIERINVSVLGDKYVDGDVIVPTAKNLQRWGQIDIYGNERRCIDYTNNSDAKEYINIFGVYDITEPQVYKNVTILSAVGLEKEYCLETSNNYQITLPSGYRIIAFCNSAKKSNDTGIDGYYDPQTEIPQWRELNFSGWGNQTITTEESNVFGYPRKVSKITFGNRTDINTMFIAAGSLISRVGTFTIDWFINSPIETTIYMQIYTSGGSFAFTETIAYKIKIGVNKLRLKLRCNIVAKSLQLYFKNTDFNGHTFDMYAIGYYDETKPMYLQYDISKDIYCVGDSLTANGRYEATLNNILPTYSVVNRGIGGENVPTIFGRTNSIPLKVADDITIPATTIGVNVTLTNDYNSILLPLLQSGNSHECNIAGVDGVLNTTASAGSTSATYTFTRNKEGEEVDVKIGEPIWWVSGAQYGKIPQGAHQIIWVGQNGGYADSAELIEMIRTHINVSQPQKYLVLSPPQGSTSIIQNIENDFSKAFGGSYINVRKQMINNGIRIALEKGYLSGDYPTSGDLEDIANSIVPRSLRSDNVHFNNVGYDVLANIIANQINFVW